MDGELWKWTNYWNGWQSRWFILENGILSYYKSFEEVEQGCKGSINVSECEISPNHTDNTRMDLIIPGEQSIYVRARSDKERQRWLIALGSAKAGISCPQRPRISSSTSPPSTSSSAESLRTKRSELRLYSDMIMQQVHSIKEAAKAEHIDMEKLDEGSSVLCQTCDTFISTLDQLLVLAEAVGGVEGGPVHPHHHHRSKAKQVISSHKAAPQSRVPSDGSTSGVSPGPQNGFKSVFGGGEVLSQRQHSRDSRDIAKKLSSGGISEADRPRKNFLASNSVDEFALPFHANFPDPGEDGLIPTEAFLHASEEAIKVFDLLDAKTFSPIKLDLQAHIVCLRTKHNSDRTTFADINSVVASETADNKARLVGSASGALVWLARGLAFVHNFLGSLVGSSDENESLKSCLEKAYEETLMPHHGLVVRSVFCVAMKHCPSRSHFLSSLGLPSSAIEQEFFQTRMVPNLARYLGDMERCLTALMDVLRKHKLEGFTKK